MRFFYAGTTLILAVTLAALASAAESTEPSTTTEVLVSSTEDAAPATEDTAPAGTTDATDEADTETNERPPYSLLTTPGLTGDWGGVRTDLEELGFTLSPVLYTGYTHNMRGGRSTSNAHDLPGMVQYNVELDFDKMGLVPGGSFFIRATQTWNDGIRRKTGSISRPTHVWGDSGDNEILVDKWWWRQDFFDGRLELRLGKLLNIVDLFDMNEYAGNMYTRFTNSFLTSNPVFPAAKSIGAFIRVRPTDWLYFQAAAMDPYQIQTRTGFDTAFHSPCHFYGFWEMGLTPTWNTAKGPMPGNYRFGLWYDPRTKTVFRDTRGGELPERKKSGDVGFYLNFDQLVWKENDDPADSQGLGVFGRYGYAQGDVNLIEHFWSVGAQYQGLIPTRDRDILAFGVGQGILSRQYRSEINRLADRETVYETYYLIQVTPWMQLSPHLQVITNPGGTRDARDALVGGARLRVLF